MAAALELIVKVGELFESASRPPFRGAHNFPREDAQANGAGNGVEVRFVKALPVESCGGRRRVSHPIQHDVIEKNIFAHNVLRVPDTVGFTIHPESKFLNNPCHLTRRRVG